MDSECSDTAPVTSDEQQEDSVEAVLMFVGALNSHSTAWRVDLQLLGADFRLTIDTGADVSVVPESIFQRIPNKPSLQPCQHVLVSAANTSLEPVDQFGAEISSAATGTTSTCAIYVVRELCHCLLGCQDSVALGLIKPLFAMTAVPDEQDTIVSHTAHVPDQMSPLPIPDLQPSPILGDLDTLDDAEFLPVSAILAASDSGTMCRTSPTHPRRLKE